MLESYVSHDEMLRQLQFASLQVLWISLPIKRFLQNVNQQINVLTNIISALQSKKKKNEHNFLSLQQP